MLLQGSSLRAGGPGDQPGRGRRREGTAPGCGEPKASEHGLVLIVKATYRDKWQFPGGVLDHNEDPIQCAQRELLEETGLHTSSLALSVVTWSLPGPRLPHPSVNFVFDAGTFKAPDIQLQADELEAHMWARPDEAQELLLPSAALRMTAALEVRKTGSVQMLHSGDDC
ncbi:NUDIX domain-containing protein [Streptomyces sp. G1]|uniref:NUDIX domain-containing protein n=1 Tax=Streptomyces sp. G1 TaxID=361572 RepID=UPI00202E3C2F|nr:NUDIX hydrolase [Streptomyces sp. G1]MCM1976399.1 NUDIX hydrolase [Streptomyces sp. G1]